MPSVLVQPTATTQNALSDTRLRTLPFDAKVQFYVTQVTASDTINIEIGGRSLGNDLKGNIEATANPIVPDNLVAADVGLKGEEVRVQVTGVTTRINVLVVAEPLG